MKASLTLEDRSHHSGIQDVLNNKIIEIYACTVKRNGISDVSAKNESSWQLWNEGSKRATQEPYTRF